MTSKFFPDRKWLASGVAGVLTWALVQYLGLDAEVATAAVGGVMALVHYFVPASVNDVLKRVDSTIIQLAGGKPAE